MLQLLILSASGDSTQEVSVQLFFLDFLTWKTCFQRCYICNNAQREDRILLFYAGDIILKSRLKCEGCPENKLQVCFPGITHTSVFVLHNNAPRKFMKT